MIVNKKDIEKIVENLKKCKTEEEIFKNIKNIIKGYNISLYKNIILSNPYYKSLIPDIKIEIRKEIMKIRESIINEIKEIDKELSKSNNYYIDELKELKRECFYLLHEIDDREKDINSLK
jgi:HEPN domain-containing protein